MRIAISKHFVRSFIVFVALGLCTPVFGQSTSDNPVMAKGKKAYSIPVSDRNIQFEVTAPSGEIFAISVQEGGMAKILDFKDGYAYALVPIIKDINSKTADFVIYRITQDKDGNESIQELEHINPNFDTSVTTKAEPKMQVKLFKIDPPTSASSISDNSNQKQVALVIGAHKDCCVTCGNITACGNAVCASCGSCHDPGTPKLDCPIQN